MDRRTTLQWMLAATALPLAAGATTAVKTAAKSTPGAAGYGTDPNLVRSYRGGELWPLSFSAAQRVTAAALCNLIIPADDQSPGAAELQVHQFIDEWISAPYPAHRKDRRQILQGLGWIDREAQRRFGQPVAAASGAQQQAIADDICWLPRAAPRFTTAARFFARYRDLTGSGFYTTPEGTQDLRFVGNRPSPRFDGPPAEVLKLVGVN